MIIQLMYLHGKAEIV